jgi:YfiH family protein
VSGPRPIEVAADPGVRVAFSTREGGVSEGPWRGLNLAASTGDRPAAVRANRRALCEALGIDATRVCMLRQVHGSGVIGADAPLRPGRFAGGLSGWPEGDALVGGTPGVPLVVLAADCLPVLIWRRDGTAAAAAHAGWRGLMAGVLESAAAALGPAEGLAAAVGPGVSPARYPVDAALRARFAERFGPAVVRDPAVDLAAAARVALERAGVASGQITTVAACTASEPDRFYSHRRDGARTGRQAGVIWLDRP